MSARERLSDEPISGDWSSRAARCTWPHVAAVQAWVGGDDRGCHSGLAVARVPPVDAA